MPVEPIEIIDAYRNFPLIEIMGTYKKINFASLGIVFHITFGWNYV